VAICLDTGSKFAVSIIDTGGKFATIDLQISPQIFEKFKMTLMLFSGAWGKMIHEKT
jgi:hypothetical protein